MLDVGCGRGAMTWAMEERGISAVGVDIAEDFRYSKRCAAANAIALPFAVAFDCIAALDLVEHVPADYQDALLAELRRACSGLMFATVPTDGPALMDDSSVGVRNHYLVLSPDAWARHFAAHGFDVVADAERLSAFGVPFAWGAANYPFALRPGAREN
jgi:SAM-dependent methyltransferase